jgi:energy-coupling factor transport system permease protein
VLANFSYVERASPIHRLDPGVKVIFMLCFIFSIILFMDLRVLAVFLAIGAVYYALAQLKWRETRRAWTFILVFVFLFVGINTIIFGDGENIANPHLIFRGPFGFALTWENLYYTAAVMMRMIGIALVSLPLTFTTKPQDYGVAFRGIGLPDKFAVALDLALRLVPTFANDFQGTLDAQRARGYETEGLRGGPIGKLRRMAPILIPVTINAIVGGEDIINAMDLRAFGTGKRTWSRMRTRTATDWLVIAASVALLLASITFALLGGGQYTVLWLP